MVADDSLANFSLWARALFAVQLRSNPQVQSGERRRASSRPRSWLELCGPELLYRVRAIDATAAELDSDALECGWVGVGRASPARSGAGVHTENFLRSAPEPWLSLSPASSRVIIPLWRGRMLKASVTCPAARTFSSSSQTFKQALACSSIFISVPWTRF